jgi:hypothetical protein
LEVNFFRTRRESCKERGERREVAKKCTTLRTVLMEHTILRRGPRRGETELCDVRTHDSEDGTQILPESEAKERRAKVKETEMLDTYTIRSL